jgi:hypothetical protein
MKIVNCLSLGEMCEAGLDGEPVFLIRAKDKLALTTVKYYLQQAIDYNGKNLTRVRTVIAKMEKWEKENPGKMKLPD